MATNDAYFEGPEHFEAHDALMCIEKKLFVSQADRTRLSKEHYFKTQNEMLEQFHDLPEALNNTIEIAQRCVHRPKIKNPILPVYDDDQNKEKELLQKLAKDGLDDRLNAKFNIENIDIEQQSEMRKVYEER